MDASTVLTGHFRDQGGFPLLLPYLARTYQTHHDDPVIRACT